MNTQEKIQSKIDELCKRADNIGHAKLSVCNAMNWDIDFWNYKHDIVDTIRRRGYNVSLERSDGVDDIMIFKNYNFV